MDGFRKKKNETNKQRRQWINCEPPPTKQLKGKQRIDRNKPCPCGSGVKYKKCDHSKGK